MPEYVAPGVYVEEIGPGLRPIEGVATAIAAFLGVTERGPTAPRLVASFTEYRRHFGDASSPGEYMPDALSGFFANGGERAYVCRIVRRGTPTAECAFGSLRLIAAGPGDWGRRIRAKIVDATATADGDAASFRLRVAYWQNPAPASGYPDPFDPADDAGLPRPILTEDFDKLSLDPASPDFYVDRLRRDSALVAAAAGATPIAAADIRFGAGAFEYPEAPAPAGSAGDRPGPDDYEGATDPAAGATGLAALELDPCRDVALVAAPGITDPVIVDAIVTHCETMRFRFAVLDGEANPADPSAMDPRSRRPSGFAAYYIPWLVSADLQTGLPRQVPPSGHVLGIYARTDAARGVWQAPANQPLLGLLDLAYPVDAEQQAILNPKGVNVIRNIPGRGIRLWGARTLSDDPTWIYVNVRRLFIFLERSIHEGTQWAVFEPNDQRLWARVLDTVRLFLRTQWTAGALAGRTEEEAFFAGCDSSTMSQEDIASGRLICEIGVAPLRPAEFVIFRIFQKTAEAQS